MCFSSMVTITKIYIIEVAHDMLQPLKDTVHDILEDMAGVEVIPVQPPMWVTYSWDAPWATSKA